MKKIGLIIIALCSITHLTCQTKFNPKSKDDLGIEQPHQLRIALGVSLGDGLIFLSKNFVPSFGISYEYQLSKRLSIASHILTHYSSDFDLKNSLNKDFPFLSKFRGSESPFFTQKEKDELNNSGIVPINSWHYEKALSVPIDIGLTFYPLNNKHHRIGINTAFSVTYSNYNWYPDSFTGILTLKDGTTRKITLEVPTEFRNLSYGFSPKLFYTYSFKDCSIGIRAANYNFFFANKYSVPIWETSLLWGLKF